LKTLIIRTDRLGDFYQTIPYINCLIRNYGKTNVDIVVKKHIYPHIKKKKYLYNNLYSFEKSGIFNKILLILKLRKNNYKQIIIFDGKDRSIILSKFLNVDKIFHTYPQKKINLLTKIFFSKKYTTIFDNQIIPLKYLYKDILDKIGVRIIKRDYKILLYQNIKKINILKNENIKNKKYILIHLDEKWFSGFYIKKYTDISLKRNDFFLFIKKIVKICRKNLIITTGTINLPFITKISNEYFKNNKKTYCYLKIGKYKIILLKKISIENLEIITMNANSVITCHGPLSLISGSFNINLIDIIEKNQEKWYERHTSQIMKYKKLYRIKFSK
jgi:hypothetical protein